MALIHSSVIVYTNKNHATLIRFTFWMIGTPKCRYSFKCMPSQNVADNLQAFGGVVSLDALQKIGCKHSVGCACVT